MAKFSKSSTADAQVISKQMIFWRLDPLWSLGFPNPRVESNDVKLIFIFVLFNKYYCVLSKNFVTYSTGTQIYISTTCKTAMTTSGKISKNIQFQSTHAGFTIFSVHSQHLKSSSSAFRPALSNLWLLLVYSFAGQHFFFYSDVFGAMFVYLTYIKDKPIVTTA